MFTKHNEDVKALIGISKSAATHQKYEVTRKHLSEFIQYKYHLADISVKEITPMFINDFGISDGQRVNVEQTLLPSLFSSLNVSLLLLVIMVF